MSSLDYLRGTKKYVQKIKTKQKVYKNNLHSYLVRLGKIKCYLERVDRDTIDINVYEFVKMKKFHLECKIKEFEKKRKV